MLSLNLPEGRGGEGDREVVTARVQGRSQEWENVASSSSFQSHSPPPPHPTCIRARAGIPLVISLGPTHLPPTSRGNAHLQRHCPGGQVSEPLRRVQLHCMYDPPRGRRSAHTAGTPPDRSRRHSATRSCTACTTSGKEDLQDGGGRQVLQQ